MTVSLRHKCFVKYLVFPIKFAINYFFISPKASKMVSNSYLRNTIPSFTYSGTYVYIEYKNRTRRKSLPISYLFITSID